MQQQRFWMTGMLLSSAIVSLDGWRSVQAAPLVSESGLRPPQQSLVQPSSQFISSPPINNQSINVYPPGYPSYRIETYHSSVMNSLRTYGIALPPDYEQHPNEHYPVVFLLHGGHGDPTDWFRKGNAIITLQQLYSQGKLPPSIVITPDGYDNRGSSAYWDPQYLDGPNGKIASAIGDELVSIVQQRYRTLPSPDFWAIGGLSSGGWGAMNIGLHFTNHFSILFSHSGYFVDQSGIENSPIDVVKILPKDVQQRLRIYLDSGEGDSFYLKQSREFQQVLDQLHVINVFHTFPGSHSWNYWRQHLADSLTFVGEQFQNAQLIHAAAR